MSSRERPTTRRAGAPALPASGLRLLAALTERPSVLLRRGGSLVTELARIGLGRSDLGPHPGAPSDGGTTDRLRRRAVQTWLAAAATLSGVLDDAGAHTARLGPADAERLRAAARDLAALLPSCAAGADAAAPARPAPARAGTAPDDRPPGDAADPDGAAEPDGTADPGVPREGATGPRAATPALLPGRVFTAPGPGDPGVPFDTGARDAGTGPVPGRDVAATPGAVVLRTPMFELLQYLPATEQVHDTPVLVVPPLVHRYWLVDLAPGSSLVEHLLRAGLQVFALSWRPAGPADAGRDLDAHAAAVLDALDACTRITRSPRASLLGLRTGGLLAAAVQAHLEAIGLDDRVAAAAYLATVLDRPAAVRARAWRRDEDRVPPSAMPEHPAGRAPGGADRALRAWAADQLPLPAALHADLVAPAASGPDGAPGTAVLGTPLRAAELRRDGYLVTAADDPERPWTVGHRTAATLGGRCRLVLAPGDRTGALIAPPGTGTSFRAGPCDAGDGTADGWRAAAVHTDGSWWDDLAGWLATRSGVVRDAPPELGGRRLRPVFPAPGTYLGPAADAPADGSG